MHETDVVIVGAGPIGIELAVALKRAGVDYLHLEAGQIGQTIMWYPRQVKFFSSPERISLRVFPCRRPTRPKPRARNIWRTCAAWCNTSI